MKPNTYDLKGFYNNILSTHPLRYGHQFTLEFFGRDLGNYMKTGDFIGNGDGSDPLTMFTYFAQSASIPKLDIGSAKVNYLAAGFEVPGIVKYPDSWSVEIIIDQGLTQYNRLLSWEQAMSDYRRSQGGSKTIPNIFAKVNLLDNTMRKITKSYIMEGVWIEDLGALDFQYQEGSSDVAKCSCTFAMQYWYDYNERRSTRILIIYLINILNMF